MISIVQQVQSLNAQSGSAENDSVQPKRGRGDFENLVQGQRKSSATEVPSDSAEPPKDAENAIGASAENESADALQTDGEATPEGQDVIVEDVAEVPPQSNDGIAVLGAAIGSQSAETPPTAAETQAASSQNGSSVVQAPVSQTPIDAVLSSEGDAASDAVPVTAQGLEDLEAATDVPAEVAPLVGLAAGQAHVVQQPTAAPVGSATARGGQRAAQGGEILNKLAETAATPDGKTVQGQASQDIRLQAASESLRAELAANSAVARTAAAAPLVTPTTWAIQPNVASARPATGSGLSSMMAAGTTASATVAGVSLSALGGDDKAVGLSAQLSSAAIPTDRPADMIALPQMLTEASVRAGSSTAPRDGTPRFVAMQLAEAAMQGKPKVDVVLNPQELGNVTMRLSTTETGIAMVIQAERPETEELMRRHIHELEKEFKEMGFENIEFNFAGSGAEHSSSGESSSGEAGEGLREGDVLTEIEQEAAAIGGHLNLAAEVLDMRV